MTGKHLLNILTKVKNITDSISEVDLILITDFNDQQLEVFNLLLDHNIFDKDNFSNYVSQIKTINKNFDKEKLKKTLNNPLIMSKIKKIKTSEVITSSPERNARVNSLFFLSEDYNDKYDLIIEALDNYESTDEKALFNLLLSNKILTVDYDKYKYTYDSYKEIINDVEVTNFFRKVYKEFVLNKNVMSLPFDQYKMIMDEISNLKGKNLLNITPLLSHLPTSNNKRYIDNYIFGLKRVVKRYLDSNNNLEYSTFAKLLSDEFLNLPVAKYHFIADVMSSFNEKELTEDYDKIFGDVNFIINHFEYFKGLIRDVKNKPYKDKTIYYSLLLNENIASFDQVDGSYRKLITEAIDNSISNITESNYKYLELLSHPTILSRPLPEYEKLCNLMIGFVTNDVKYNSKELCKLFVKRDLENLEFNDYNNFFQNLLMINNTQLANTFIDFANRCDIDSTLKPLFSTLQYANENSALVYQYCYCLSDFRIKEAEKIEAMCDTVHLLYSRDLNGGMIEKVMSAIRARNNISLPTSLFKTVCSLYGNVSNFEDKLLVDKMLDNFRKHLNSDTDMRKVSKLFNTIDTLDDYGMKKSIVDFASRDDIFNLQQMAFNGIIDELSNCNFSEEVDYKIEEFDNNKNADDKKMVNHLNISRFIPLDKLAGDNIKVRVPLFKFISVVDFNDDFDSIKDVLDNDNEVFSNTKIKVGKKYLKKIEDK